MQNMHKSMYLHILHIYALPTLLMVASTPQIFITVYRAVSSLMRLLAGVYNLIADLKLRHDLPDHRQAGEPGREERELVQW